MKVSMLPTLLAGAAATLALAPSGLAQTGYQWGHEFDTPTLPQGEIISSAVFDDGSGPALYLGGQFREIHGEGAFGVVRFDGSTWEPLGGGLGNFTNEAFVRALEVFDPDGSGPQQALLVAAGEFQTANGTQTLVKNVAAWDGTTWSALGAGLPTAQFGFLTPEVLDLQSYDDGSGPKLYAAGRFAVGFAVGLAVWDGSTWSSIGSAGVASGWANALEVIDEGAGPRLFVGGTFSGIVGAPNSAKLARWDGTSFSGVASGLGDIHGLVRFDPDGAGPLPDKLVASGGGDLDVWDGTTMTHVPGFSAALTAALAVFDDGGGPAVYLGANDIYTTAGNRMHKWDGVSASMVPVGSPVDMYLTVAFMQTLVVFNNELYAGGYFSGTQAAPSRGLLKWDGSDWVDPFPRKGLAKYEPAATFSGAGKPNLLGAVSYDGGGGAELFMGGIFNRAGNTLITTGLAAWDGSSWSDAGPTSAFGAAKLTIPLGTWDDGSGLALYAGVEVAPGGSFKVYRLNGSTWSEVGASTAAFIKRPTDMALFDDGTGVDLFVLSGKDLHRWDGTSWTLAASATGFVISSIGVFDDGTGASLYVGGAFSSVAGVTAKNIAAFDGSTWSALGSGATSAVTSMAVFDDGSGLALYAGGTFTSAGGVAGTNGVARWDGSSWSSLGGGSPNITGVLGIHDDGLQKRLYTSATDSSLSDMARFVRSWDGTAWVDVPDSFTFGKLSGLVEHNDGFGPSAYFWGGFRGLGGTVIDPQTTMDSANQAGGIVRWGPPTGSTFTTSGVGCSLYSSDIPSIHGQGTAQVGTSSFSTTMKNVPAGMPAALLVGTATDFWNGIPLPFDMAPLGWAGCNLYQNWQFTFWTATTGGPGLTAGEATLPIAIPSLPSLVGADLNLQWGVLVLNPLGFDLGVTGLGVVTVE